MIADQTWLIAPGLHIMMVYCSPWLFSVTQTLETTLHIHNNQSINTETQISININMSKLVIWMLKMIFLWIVLLQKRKKYINAVKNIQQITVNEH